MISRDGGWVSVMPSDGGAMCFMYHVRWVKRKEREREGGRGEVGESTRRDGSLKRERKQRAHGASAQCDGRAAFDSKADVVFRNASRALHIYPQEERAMSSREERRRAGGISDFRLGPERRFAIWLLPRIKICITWFTWKLSDIGSNLCVAELQDNNGNILEKSVLFNKM